MMPPGSQLLADHIQGGHAVFECVSCGDVADVGDGSPAVHDGQAVEFAADPFGCPVGLGAVCTAAPVQHADDGRHAALEVRMVSRAVYAQNIPQPIDPVRCIEQSRLGGLNPIED